MIRLSAFAVAALMFCSGAHADPTGIYRVTGFDTRSQKPYEGTVIVSRISEKYAIEWRVGGREIRGVALGGAIANGSFMIGPAHPDDLMLSIGFFDGSVYGAATMFLQQDGSYEGFRVNSRGAKAGRERWSPAD